VASLKRPALWRVGCLELLGWELGESNIEQQGVTPPPPTTIVAYTLAKDTPFMFLYHCNNKQTNEGFFVRLDQYKADRGSVPREYESRPRCI